jgi:uncharacterized OB-fold protein
MSMGETLADLFWQGCAAGELRYQRCDACGAAQFRARPFCARCGGLPRWAVSRGLGTVYAATQVTRAPTPDFAALVPYDILLVDLDEGFRMMAHGAPGLRIGERVRVAFRRGRERALPRFERQQEDPS